MSFARSPSRRFVCVLLLSALLAACGGDEAVRYEGTLVVDGVEYKREHEGGIQYAKGVLLVFVRDGQETGLRAELARYGLTVIERRSQRTLLVAVPEGYELQWMSALSKLPQVETAGTEDPTYQAP